MSEPSPIKSNDLSSSKGKEEVRYSSISKNQKTKKEPKVNDELKNSKNKLTNPEVEG